MRLRVFIALVLGMCLLPLGVSPTAAQARPSEEPFAILPGSFHIIPSTTEAGAHVDLTTEFDFAHDSEEHTYGDVRETVVELPPGFIGNNTAVPTCTVSQLLGTAPGTKFLAACPLASVIGQLSFIFEGKRNTVPLYNMEVNSFGITAELGFKFILATGVFPITVRPGDSGLTVTAPDIEAAGEIHGVSVTVWGLPASHEHDLQRDLVCEQGEPCFNAKREGPQPVNLPVKPFLSNPTSCGTFKAKLRAYSWEGQSSEAETTIGPIGECERVPFGPSIEVAATTRSVESSSGLDVSLLVPQSWENPISLSTANLKDSVVTLPVGYTANPSLASGLVGCTPAQFESETSSSPPGAGCPAESKIGEVDVETPVLVEKHLTGNIYIATPYDNKPEFGTPEHPGGSLLALYIVVKDPERGIIVKLAGKIEANETTGQLVTTFDNNPQVPFSKFTLKLRQGANSPLVSPPTCGSYTAEASLTPWSAPLVPRLVTSSFQIENGIGGGPCPAGGVPPFHPQVVSGTQNNAGGSYSPFYLRILRADGEQELTRFSTTLPPGLTGNLTGIPFCPDAAIEAAKAPSRTGAQELQEPSCPASSEIGHTIVSAGVGAVLAQTPGKIYLAGPYHGAPLSIVSITSAKVGPFDLGTVVIRFALNINPTTAQVEVSASGSDPIPHIIKGIVVHVREIHVYMNRPNFILNPTNCNPLQISNTIDGAGADFTNPADQVPVTVTSPFEAADCQGLQFKPVFKVTTSGKTSRSAGASLAVKLTIPAALGTQANITRVKVDLPKQLPSRLTTLQKGCTAAQFNTNPAGCPAASVVGHAKAITPLIPVPLEGPAYFVSHGGEAFPSLIVVLQGYGFTIDLVGSTFISKSGITSSTFKTVPDQPVTSFELTLPEGKFSALAANGNLCAVTKTVTVSKRVTRRIHGHTKRVTVKVKQSVAAPLAMPTEFVAQNGAVIHQSTAISVTGCTKVVRHERKKKHTKKKKK
jgi:hypothetical protein